MLPLHCTAAWGLLSSPRLPPPPLIDFDAQKAVTLNFLALRMGSPCVSYMGGEFDVMT